MPRSGVEQQPADLTRLLGQAASGDQGAWSALVHSYSKRVYALAKSRIRGHDAAEEITQSVFATVAAKLSSGQYSEQGRFEAWLFRVTMNRVRDEVRRAKVRAVASDPATFEQTLADPGERSPAVDGETRELGALRRSLMKLSESDREIVELRHHAGMSFKHIAELLSEPMGTVLARHHRALKKLKELIGGGSTESDGGEP